MTKIRLNGHDHDIDDGATIAALLDSLKIPHQGTAVAVNDAIVPRDMHPTTRLDDGDRVEVIRAIGGG